MLILVESRGAKWLVVAVQLLGIQLGILNPTISPFLVRSLSEISFAQWKRLLLLPLKLGQGPRFGATEICNPSAGRKQQTRFLSRCVPDMLVSQGYHSRCCLVVSNFNRYGWLASEERAAKKPSRADSAGLAKVGFGLWTSLDVFGPQRERTQDNLTSWAASCRGA